MYVYFTGQYFIERGSYMYVGTESCPVCVLAPHGVFLLYSCRNFLQGTGYGMYIGHVL